MLEATCWMLLRRYGVVFREMLERESNVPRWREVADRVAAAGRSRAKFAAAVL